MFDSVLKTSCEIIDYGWTKDRTPVDTFIMGLAASIREHNDYEEQVGCFLNRCRSIGYINDRTTHILEFSFQFC